MENGEETVVPKTPATKIRQVKILLEIKDLSEKLLLSATSLQVCVETKIKDSIRVLLLEYKMIEELSEKIPEEKTSP